MAFIRTDVSEERIASIIKVKRNQLLVTANVVLSLLILVTLIMEAVRSSETPIIRRGTRHHIQ
jgi:hypothetical protein